MQYFTLNNDTYFAKRGRWVWTVKTIGSYLLSNSNGYLPAGAIEIPEVDVPEHVKAFAIEANAIVDEKAESERNARESRIHDESAKLDKGTE